MFVDVSYSSQFRRLVMAFIQLCIPMVLASMKERDSLCYATMSGESWTWNMTSSHIVESSRGQVQSSFCAWSWHARWKFSSRALWRKFVFCIVWLSLNWICYVWKTKVVCARFSYSLRSRFSCRDVNINVLACFNKFIMEETTQHWPHVAFFWSCPLSVHTSSSCFETSRHCLARSNWRLITKVL